MTTPNATACTGLTVTGVTNGTAPPPPPTPPASDNSGLSTGAIVGIVLGSVAAAAIGTNPQHIPLLQEWGLHWMHIIYNPCYIAIVRSVLLVCFCVWRKGRKGLTKGPVSAKDATTESLSDKAAAEGVGDSKAAASEEAAASVDQDYTIKAIAPKAAVAGAAGAAAIAVAKRKNDGYGTLW